MPETSWPRVRVVVLNWNSGWYTSRCLRALICTNYPADLLEIVVVDNASRDGSLEQLRYEFPRLRFIRNPENLGFAEGCNVAMRDLDGLEHVALINNDAVVEANWLKPLVEASRSKNLVGAVAARLVLEPAFTPVSLVVDGGSVLIERVFSDCVDATERTIFRGCRSVGRPEWPMDLDHHVDHVAELMVPCGESANTISIRVSGTGTLTAATRSGTATVELSDRTAVLDVDPGSRRTELMNGLGTKRGVDGEGADCFFGIDVDDLEAAWRSEDAGSAVRPVQGFCGGGVLLNTEMLSQVGLFDPRFFAYYEDMDLSWRARRAGWEILAAPDSVVRHSFGGSGGAKSAGFFFLNYRNWLLTVLRNGDRVERRHAFASAWNRIKWAMKANILLQLRHRCRPDLRLMGAWARVVAGLLVCAPFVLSAAKPGSERRTARLPGARPKRRVRSVLQPSGRPPVPNARPGGPLVLYVDVSGCQGRFDQKIELRDSLILLLQEDQAVQAVPVVAADTLSGYRRLSPSEMGEALGVGGPYTSVTPEDLALDQLAEQSKVIAL